ncbi:serine/threonine protein kinase [Acaryochloris sp. 'Moss Beach']|uniref:serine/threonine-protein kinase n=1 Tax=Acaryochloris sp. 'Moss Beach' TaxID=2740837 RepID=UPI001F406E49|nr:serine/threonine-protein kinase [Acaryochloris sp. 'Moss Beach']UJB68815.1 serine/threonine protein kinase [Acaryochloris sp. 'Moss Beach']
MPTQQYHPPATTIANRYRIVRELGQGGFGCTYLVEDIHRFNERCVLKEFAPASESSEILLTKAKELFVREAAVLYKLDHPQIPQFREWFMGPQDRSLCLVQDYVEGDTYQALLRERVKQGQTYTESEIYRFLTQLLPVLDYIHRQGLIHRDISPDNLIQRQRDGLPILIDFGGVKQITASFGKFVDPNNPEQKFGGTTILGKPGYAPEEQIRLGKVYEHSDLYALGVTALVMLMGQDPQEFYDANIRAFQWRHIGVDEELARILETMVATQANARYPSAQRALRDLEQLGHLATPSPGRKLPTPPPLNQTASDFPPPPPTDIAEFKAEVTQHTVVAEPVVKEPGVVTKVGNKVQNWTITLLKQVMILGAIATLLGGVIWAIRERVDTSNVAPVSQKEPAQPKAPPSLSREELSRKARLFERIDALGVSSRYFNQVTNEAFFLEYPNYQGRALTRNEGDAPLREQWDEVGFQVLEAMGKLNPEVRDRIGQYQLRDRKNLDQQLRRKKVNRRRFYRRVEETLVDDLPMYRNVDLPGKRAQQLWFAIAQDRFLEIEDDE